MFLQARNYIQSLAQMPKMNFANVFIGANPLGKLISFIWGLETLLCKCLLDLSKHGCYCLPMLSHLRKNHTVGYGGRKDACSRLETCGKKAAD